MAEKATRKRSRRKQPGLTLASQSRRRSAFAPVEDAVDAIRQGQMVVVVDDEDRENEGDLTVAAEKTTPDIINFMAKYGRGLICLPMTGDWLDRLNIPLMVRENTSQFDTAFCVSIEAKESTSTGISAADRATTACVAVDAKTQPNDLARPGHMFPLRARDGGVLVRAGQTEAAVDLARIAGLRPAGVICEIMNEDGTMARVPELRRFARKHKLLMITIADLIKYRMRNERLVRRTAAANLPTEYGDFELVAFESIISDETHLALVRGESWRRRGRAGAGSFMLSDRRGVPFGPVRLWRPAGHGHAANCGRGPGCPPVSEPGRPRHRSDEQDPGLPTPGPGL